MWRARVLSPAAHGKTAQVDMNAWDGSTRASAPPLTCRGDVQIFLSQAAWATTAASQRQRDDLGLADDVATEALNRDAQAVFDGRPTAPRWLIMRHPHAVPQGNVINR